MRLSTFARRVVVQQLLTGVFGGLGFACKGTSDSTGGRAHNPQEQNVEVISVWEGSCGQHVPHVVPRSLSHTRGWILSASDGTWNVLISTYSHTSNSVRFSGRLSPVVSSPFAL